MIHLNFIGLLGGNDNTDPLGLLFNVLFFGFFLIMMFYGQKIQGWQASKQIETALDKLKNWNDDCKEILFNQYSKYSNEKDSDKDVKIKLEELMQFVTIGPVDLDPYGIIPKFDHIIDVRDNRFENEVQNIAPKADSIKRQNLENLLEASMAVDMVYRLIKHYLIMGKKSKSMILLMSISMQLTLIMAMAKSYYNAAKAFAEGSPIGDALGPMVVGSLVRDIIINEDVSAIEIAKDTIYQQFEFEGRTIFVVRAKGPGGTVGKPGKAIKKLVEEHGESISRIITIDAGLKLEGEKTGSIIFGVGSAIGGIGIEKSYMEDSSTKNLIPIEAFICKQSLEDAITTMNRSITQSVPKIVTKIKTAIRERTEVGTKVIVAGIGNTIGIGI
ncbi:MAG: DUF1512 domain-containing protein [Candidatus Lokiarchaeota archaeon]|nr:DUF1512 domain-containing protein [Candidatus Lokiarchaeota archaeon]